MKRWLILLLLAAPSSGCMMLEDLLFVDDATAQPPAVYQYATAEPPQASCNQNIANVNAFQTAEPELLQAGK